MRKRTGYLIRRGKVFYAAWTVAGKKFMQTTGKRDRRDAEKELRRIMEPFVAGDEITTLQNISARIQGHTIDLKRIEDERNPPLTLAAAWSAYVRAPGRPDSGDRTMEQYESHFTAFSDWMHSTHSAIAALRDVTPAIAGDYARHLAERGLSPNRFNKHIRFLELLFRVSKDAARLTVNPWEGIQRKRMVPQSRRELTTDELKAVCGTAEGEMRLLFALGIYTGLRLGDCSTLRWAEVDTRRRLVRRIPSKTARRNPRPVIVPIHPVLLTMLNEIRPSARGEYVLPGTAEKYLRAAPDLSRSIQDHFEANGIRTTKNGTGFVVQKDKAGKEQRVSTGKRAVVEVGFHSLRHTFVSMCREANAPLAVVEAIVGHSNPAMTRHYTHVSEQAAGLAVSALPSVIDNVASVKALPAPKITSPADLRALVESLNAKNWRTTRAKLLSALPG